MVLPCFSFALGLRRRKFSGKEVDERSVINSQNSYSDP
ncbi:hypothetical protein SMG44B_20581 [Stenotrophomonas maltophilia]